MQAIAALLTALALAYTAAAQEEQVVGRRIEETDPLGNVIRNRFGARLEIPRERAFDAQQQQPALAVAPETVQLAGADPNTISLDRMWTYSVWGTSIGRTGMVPIDLDGDGRLEIVMGASNAGTFGSNNSWIVVRNVPGGTDYAIVRSSGPIAAGVGSVTAALVGGKARIYVGQGDGTLVIHDGASYAEIGRVKHASQSITGLVLADADNDGQGDLVLVTSSALYVLDPVTAAKKSQIAHGASSAAVGNVDADAKREIVLSGGKVLEYDGTTTKVEWDFSVFAPAAYLALSDVDGDGMQEIVAARGWDYIDVYDADLKSPKFQIESDLDIQSLLTVDVTGDGREEILYGDGQWGEIHAIDAVTRLEIWNMPNPEHGTTRIAVADVDADGQREVMWGAGWTSTGADYFFVHGLPSRLREFQSPDLVGPFAAVAQGDCDDDGRDEIVAISWESESGYEDGVVHVFDAETFALEWRSATNLFEGFAWTGIRDVAIGDVDGNGDSEIVVGADRLYDGTIYVIDGDTHVVEKKYLYDDGSAISALALADFDRDGRMDIVAGNSREHTGSPGTFLYVIDGATGAVKWRSVSLVSSSWTGVYALEVADVTGDGALDAVISADAIVIVDGAARTVRKTTTTGYRGLDIADFDGNGQREIWVGNASGELARIDPVTLARTTVARPCTKPLNSVRLARASSLAGSIQFACDDELGIYGAFEQQTLWRSGPIGSFAGYLNNLVVTDRGEQAFLVAGLAHGVVAYQGYGTSNTDVDDDGVLNHLDNCVELANPDQADRDGDRVGDACNDAGDGDGDEWADVLDNCGALPNSDQRDSDANGVGDACNEAEDADGDEWADPLDNCAGVANDQSNRDGDEVGDACDPYPDNPDNYRARCEEAVENEEVFGEALLLCEATRKFADADGDGEDDATDACAATAAGEAVDAAGCSIGQFCTAISAAGRSEAVCKASDWRNDEPMKGNPFDCVYRSKVCTAR